MYDPKDTRWIKNVNQLTPVKKQVILTFDDGPSSKLDCVLNILREKDVPAVFFWQSKLLHKNQFWPRVIEDGHQIGSHSIKHKNLIKLSYEEQFKQINISVKKIEEITRRKVRFFRPPFGQYNEDTMKILKKLNLIPIMWDITSYDWLNKTTPEKIVCNVVENISEGSIILLHELKQTVKALPILIDRVREKGFEFTRLPYQNN